MKISKYSVILLFLAVLNIHCSSGEIDRTGLVKVSERVYAFIAEGGETAQGLGANSGFVLGDDAVLGAEQFGPVAGSLVDLCTAWCMHCPGGLFHYHDLLRYG